MIIGKAAISKLLYFGMPDHADNCCRHCANLFNPWRYNFLVVMIPFFGHFSI